MFLDCGKHNEKECELGRAGGGIAVNCYKPSHEVVDHWAEYKQSFAFQAISRFIILSLYYGNYGT